TRHGVGWGGAWHGTIKDAMHFSLAPTEGGDGVHEPFDPHLQDAADAAWRGHPLAPPPAPKEAGVTAPPWAHEHPGDVRSVHAGCPTVTTWQQRMQDRGWEIDADGSYGADSEQVCRAFQREKGLHIDGVLGRDTWRAAGESARAIWITGWSSSPCSTGHVMSLAASKIISPAEASRRRPRSSSVSRASGAAFRTHDSISSCRASERASRLATSAARAGSLNS